MIRMKEAMRIACLGLVVYVSLTSELDLQDDACPTSTCEGHCGSSNSVSDGACFCDSRCQLHGDCCLDYLAVCTNHTRWGNGEDGDDNKAEMKPENGDNNSGNDGGNDNGTDGGNDNGTDGGNDNGTDGGNDSVNASKSSDLDGYLYDMSRTSMAHYMSCLSLDGSAKEYRIITRCPNNTSSSSPDGEGSSSISSSELCEGTLNPSDLNQIVPVYDPRTQLVFRNKFCADCHSVNTETILPVNPHFECLNSSEAIAARVNGGVKAFLQYVLTSRKCFISFNWFDVPISIHRKTCKENIIDTCDPEAKHDTEQDSINCKAYSARTYLQYPDNSYSYDFKNIHCARCNGKANGSTYCRYVSDIDLFGSAPSSFSVLMDFTSDEQVVQYENQVVCQDGHYLDVVNNECILRECPGHQLSMEGQCMDLDIAVYPVQTGKTERELHVLFKVNSEKITIKDILFDLNQYQSQIKAGASGVEMIGCNEVGRVLNDTRWVNSSDTSACVHILLKADSQGLLWEKIISDKVQNDFVGKIEFRGRIQQFVVLSYDPSVPLACSHGSLKWHDDFSMPTSDYLGEDRGTTVSLLIPATSQEYELNATLMHMVLNVSSDEWFLQFGVCELNVLTCDKLTVDEEHYNVTVINSTHAELLISPDDDTSPLKKSHVLMSDFAVTRKEKMLVVCADAFAADNTSSQQDDDNIHDTIESYLTVVGLSLSIVCLVATFIVHCIFPSLRTTAGKLLMNVSVSLMLAQLLFLTSGLGDGVNIACKALAVCQHYSWLVSFCWMNVFAIDVSLTFVRMKQGVVGVAGGKRLIAYGFYAWGVPAFLCVTALLIDLLTDLPFTYGSTKVCWISPARALLYSFALPVGLVILINSVCFLITLIVFIQTRRQASKASSSSSNADAVLICVKLSTVMGFTWLFGFLSNIQSVWFLSYVFVFFNTLQGMFLCVSFVCTKRVYRLVKHFVQTGERELSSSYVQSSTVSKTTALPDKTECKM